MKELLDSAQCVVSARLEAKIEEINREIKMLRQQQHFIIQFLHNSQLLERVGTIPKDALVELLQSAGVDEQAQQEFHRQFEKKFPERHEAFLQLLGLTSGQISEIRDWSRQQ